MFGMDALFSSPSLVKTAAKSIGFEKAALTVDPNDHSVWLSMRISGRIHQHKLPTGQIVTVDQIIELLFPGPPTDAVATADPPPS